MRPVLLLLLLVLFLVGLHRVLCAEVRVGTDGSVDSSSPAPYPVPTLLSWTPRALLIPHFLTNDECAYLKATAPKQPSWDASASFNSVYFTYAQERNDAILKSIEARIAVVTGIPVHMDEEPMCIHRITEKSLDLKERGFHHDKVNKEYSAATVLVYLEDVESGGHTAFPCAARTTAGQAASLACVQAFHGGARWFNGQRAVWFGGPDKGPGRGPPPVHLAEPLAVLATATAEVCVGTASGGLRVTPTRGTALVFFHDFTNGTGDPMAWHAGCEVKRGEKWTMQKFKERPMSQRNDKWLPKPSKPLPS